MLPYFFNIVVQINNKWNSKQMSNYSTVYQTKKIELVQKLANKGTLWMTIIASTSSLFFLFYGWAALKVNTVAHCEIF